MTHPETARFPPSVQELTVVKVGRKLLEQAGQRDPRGLLPQSEFSPARKRTSHLRFAELCSILSVNIY